MQASMGAGCCYGGMAWWAAFMLGGPEGPTSSGTRQLMVENRVQEESGLHCPVRPGVHSVSITSAEAKVVTGPTLGLLGL